MTKLTALFLCALSLSAASDADEPDGTLDPCRSGASLNQGTHAFLQFRVLPDRDTRRQSSNGGQQTSVEIGNGGDPVGYTRLKVKYTPCNSARLRDYSSETRGVLKQYMFGKEVHKELNFKATINPIGVDQTRQLLLMHRDSSRKGESWNTEIGNDQELTRYFLIDKSTAVRLELSFSENSKYSAAATAAILEVVQKGAALIAPSSTLINEANKKRFNDASTFVDTAISGLLGTDVKEKVTIEHAIGRDDSNTMLAQFVLLVPDSNSTVRRGRYGYQPVGMWTVVTEGITHSLFGKTQGPRGTERLVVTGLSAPSILSFRVTDSQTLVQYLDSRAAVDTAKTAYLKDRSKAGLAGALCSAVALESGGLGLSPADVGGAVWAYARSLEPGATNPLQGACSNLDRYPA